MRGVNPVHVRRMKRHGIVYPVRAILAAREAGIQLSLACAILEQETAGGHNIWGHDPTIYIGGWRDSRGRVHHEVTKASYLAYKHKRGTTRMQGVGPCQLTWWTTQDEADRLGGCWRPGINMKVGFGALAQNIAHYHDLRKGVKAYNGVGPAADRYATQVLAKKDKWHRILTGEAKR